MKKLLLITITLVLFLTLSACGGPTDDTSAASDDTATSFSTEISLPDETWLPSYNAFTIMRAPVADTGEVTATDTDSREIEAELVCAAIFRLTHGSGNIKAEALVSFIEAESVSGLVGSTYTLVQDTDERRALESYGYALIIFYDDGDTRLSRVANKLEVYPIEDRKIITYGEYVPTHEEFGKRDFLFGYDGLGNGLTMEEVRELFDTMYDKYSNMKQPPTDEPMYYVKRME